jgi:hypothetical protein
VFDIMGKEPLVEVAIALEKAALSDEYFISRKLYPNVDFYSGLIYKAMGFPTGADILSLRVCGVMVILTHMRRHVPCAVLHPARRRLARALGRAA